MAKKKETVTNSVALFGEEPKEVKASVKSKKEAKTVSIRKKEDDGEALKKKTNKLTSKKKAVKKDESKDNSNNSANKSRSVVSSKRSTSDTSSKSKKEVSRKPRTKSEGTSDTKQKSKTSKGSSSSDTDNSVKKSDKVVKSRQSRKTDVEPVKAEPDTSKRTRTKAVELSTGSEKPAGRKQRDAEANEEILRRAKANRHKQTRTSIIQGPKQITGKPKSLRDDLVAIVVDGEYLEVSPWSVKDGVYHQGLDSNFLVKYLHYDSVTTKYDELDKKEKNK